MNASQNLSMSPNTFRRILTAHGRSTTPGLFEVSTQYHPDKILQEIKVEKEKQASSKQDKTSSDSERIMLNYIVDNLSPPKGEIVNPPLSKIKSTTPDAIESYSFYKRPFKVNGKEAWEIAMRDLGSIDTLLNRYGYVDKAMRRDSSPEPAQKSTAIKK